MHLCGIFDEGAESGHHLLDGRTDGISHQYAADDDHSGGDETVDLGLLVDDFASLGGDDNGVGLPRCEAAFKRA